MLTPTADQLYVGIKRRLITATVLAVAFGVLAVTATKHEPGTSAPPPPTQGMISTVSSPAYCIETFSNGHWFHTNAGGHITDGACR
jgi:hypothetical protein